MEKKQLKSISKRVSFDRFEIKIEYRPTLSTWRAEMSLRSGAEMAEGFKERVAAAALAGKLEIFCRELGEARELLILEYGLSSEELEDTRPDPTDSDE